MSEVATETLCSYCTQPVLKLSEEVWFCNRCQVGHSASPFDPALIRASYRVGVERRLHVMRTGLIATFLPLDKNTLNVDYVTSISPDSRFDCATFFDSLERLPNIDQTFDRILTHLNPGGIVIISMPELQSCFGWTKDELYLQQIFARWTHNKPKEHLTYFTQQGLEYFLQKHKLEVLHIEHNESFLRYDPENPTKNIMTFVARKLPDIKVGKPKLYVEGKLIANGT